MKNNQFVKVVGIAPKLKVGKPMENVNYFLEEIERVKDQNPAIIVFPELATTGYTALDLFYQSYFIRQNNEAIHYFLKHNSFKGIVIFGAPIEYKNQLYNTSVVVKGNQVLGIVPKIFLPEYNEYFEKRHFISGIHLGEDVVMVDEFNAPMGTILFKETSKGFSFGVEICEDLYAPISPGTVLSINGAEIIINLSSSNEHLNKDELRRYLTKGTSRKNHSAYVYVSSGRHESTTDTTYSGHNMIVDDGSIIAEGELFAKESSVVIGDIDLSALQFRRRKSSTLKDSLLLYQKNYLEVEVNCDFSDEKTPLHYPISRTPFVPEANLEESFKKIKAIQIAGLAKRLEHTNANSLLVGLSGGLDSTLALLVAYDTFKFIDKDPKELYAITMPGFGTSDRTLNNATQLAEELGITLQTISITNSVRAHFEAIGHNETIKDTTFENAQARERTAILMNLANKHNGLMLGTGDLSELALGWTTFNGDHISNYSINVGLPKTVVQFMIQAYADYHYQDNEAIRSILYDILDTPISPELTGTDQQTEAVLGKYEVNDFILHRMLMKGDSEDRIRYLMKHAFTELDDKTIDQYLSTFYRRFYSQQFKRSTLPDGPKVLDISLSPRTDFKVVSDMHYEYGLNKNDQK